MEKETQRLIGVGRVLFFDLFLLAIPFLCGLIAVISLGAYPHNDDFLYARSVQLWTATGHYHFTGLNALPTVSAVTLVGWGAAFVKVFGFSFEVLRAANILLCYFGIVGAYITVCMFGCSRKCAVLVSLSLAVGPFYFGNAFTFMTDAPAVAWSCIAMPWYVLGMRKRSLANLFLASLVLSVGTWTRQTSAFVSIIPATYFLLTIRHENLPRTLAALFVSILFPFVSFMISWSGVYLPEGFQRYPGVTNDWNLKFVKEAVLHLYSIVVLIGLFQLPLLPMLFGSLRDHARRLTTLERGIVFSTGAIFLTVVLGAFFLRGGQWYITNSTGDFLQNAHFGPVFLCDRNERWGDIGGVVWPISVWQVLTIGSILSFAVLGMLMLSNLISAFAELRGVKPNYGEEHERTMIAAAACSAFAITMFVLLAAIAVRFDRYWMALLPFLLVFSAAMLGERSRTTSHEIPLLTPFLIIGLFWISLTMTHDLAAFNQARWRIVQAWFDEGLMHKDLDAGYDINGWFRSEEDPLTRPRPGDGLLQFWVGHAKRFVAVGERKNFEVIRHQPWFSWATMRRHEILGLQRANLKPEKNGHP